jgi:hypothetical protein
MAQRHYYRAFTLLTLAGYLWIGGNFISGETGTVGATLCLFKRMTGVACPSCGATRALLALLHGEIGNALYINPLGFVLLPLLLILPWWLSLDFFRRDNSFYRAGEFVSRLFSRHRWITAAGTILLVANWGWNIFKAL